MIVDTSVIVAIVAREPGSNRFVEELAAAEAIRVSAATLVESTLALEGRGGTAAGARMERLLTDLAAEIHPVTERTARLAQDGWRRFGKGRHPAALNFGDCFSYALSVERDEPLLFKGEDFALTDVKRAL